MLVSSRAPAGKRRAGNCIVAGTVEDVEIPGGGSDGDGGFSRDDDRPVEIGSGGKGVILKLESRGLVAGFPPPADSKEDA